jgi:hypothetical protein
MSHASPRRTDHQVPGARRVAVGGPLPVVRPGRRPPGRRGTNPRVDAALGLTGILIAVCAALHGAKAGPTIHPRPRDTTGHPGGSQRPTQPTGHPRPHTRIDKARLIIWQDVDCWNGNPGITCGPERTYQ